MKIRALTLAAATAVAFAALPAASSFAATTKHPSAGKAGIVKVQTALNSNGAQLDVDGRMGPKTVAALKSYQQEHNLKVTGRPDSATLKALGG